MAELLGDRARAAMCAGLLDGRYWTATELASVAGLPQATVARRLAPLVACGAVDLLKPGRSSYFALAGPQAAVDVAASTAGIRSAPDWIAPGRKPPTGASRQLRAGRTCYDHLAGQLGVTVTDLLIASGVITAGFCPGDPTPLAPLSLTVPAASSRPAVRPCVDWTERRRHAAGALPAALVRRMIELGWLRRPGEYRAIQLTERGLAGLADLLPGARPALAGFPVLA